MQTIKKFLLFVFIFSSCYVNNIDDVSGDWLYKSPDFTYLLSIKNDNTVTLTKQKGEEELFTDTGTLEISGKTVILKLTDANISKVFYCKNIVNSLYLIELNQNYEMKFIKKK